MVIINAWRSHLHIIKKKEGSGVQLCTRARPYAVVASQHMLLSMLDDEATLNKKQNSVEKNDCCCNHKKL